MSEPYLKKPAIDNATIQKILSSVPYENGFHFFEDVGKYSGETAISLFSFYEELKQHNGQGGKPVYIAFNGKVYDASSSSSWSGGTHKATHQAGKDLTQEILSAPHGEEVFAKVKQVGVLVQ